MANQVEVYKELLEAAKNCYRNSYSPYSKYRVGAALLTTDGKIFPGCNIEICSYEGSMCAERVALSGAVSQGCQNFAAIAVVSEQTPGVWPCGICRQYLAEFSIDMMVIVPNTDGGYKALPLKELLPHFFPPSALLAKEAKATQSSQ